jgi:hypothetical protein
MASTSNTIEVTPDQLLEVLKACHAAKLNPFVQGQPGVGKSAVVAAYAKSINAEFVDARLAYYAPQDVQGFPYLDTDEQGKTMRFSRPAFWPKTANPVIALEEFNCASKSVQNVALQFLNERQVGEHVLPEDAFIVLLGNRAEDRVNIEKLSSAVVNRIVNIRVRLDLNSWISWAQTHGVDPIIIAFLRFRPDLLTTFNGSKWDGVSNFASPRTWDKAGHIINCTTNKQVRHALLEGALGNAAAAEFLGFLSVFEKLPDLDAVLASPDKSDVPTDPSIIYATCAGLAKKVKPSTMGAFCTYIDRMSKEFGVFAMKTAINANQKLCSSPAFTTWSTKNQSVFA